VCASGLTMLGLVIGVLTVIANDPRWSLGLETSR
jgi:hypothetical protein